MTETIITALIIPVILSILGGIGYLIKRVVESNYKKKESAILGAPDAYDALNSTVTKMVEMSNTIAALNDKLTARDEEWRTKTFAAETKATEAVQIARDAERHAERIEFKFDQHRAMFFRVLTELQIFCWECDAKGNFIEANQIFYDLTGFEQGELKEKNWLVAIREVDRKNATRRWKQFIALKDKLLQINVIFAHKTTLKETQTSVTVETIFENGNEIYRIAARARRETD